GPGPAAGQPAPALPGGAWPAGGRGRVAPGRGPEAPGAGARPEEGAGRLPRRLLRRLSRPRRRPDVPAAAAAAGPRKVFGSVAAYGAEDRSQAQADQGRAALRSPFERKG